MSIEDRTNQIVDAFLAKIADLARRAAIDTLGATFGRNGTARAVTPMKPVGRPIGSRTRKRRDSELNALSEKFAGFVRHHPGLRIEQINRNLGTTTKELALPIRRLVAAGVIHTKHQKRATTYFSGTVAKAARA